MINVRFARNGCYHPAFGRLGMGDNAGRVYQLPDAFREPGMLPKSAEILDDVAEEVMEEILEEVGQKSIDKPRIDRDELDRALEFARGEVKKATKKRKPGVKTVAETLAKKAPKAAAPAEPVADEARPTRRARRSAG